MRRLVHPAAVRALIVVAAVLALALPARAAPFFVWLGCEPRCDVDRDGDVDSADLALIVAGQPVNGPCDPRDGDMNGSLSIADRTTCRTVCTRPLCATS